MDFEELKIKNKQLRTAMKLVERDVERLDSVSTIPTDRERLMIEKRYFSLIADQLSTLIDLVLILKVEEDAYCNECLHYDGVNRVQGVAPCRLHDKMTMWNDTCSCWEWFEKNE